MKLLPKQPVEVEVKSYAAKHRSGSSNQKFTHFIKPMLAKLHDGAFVSPDWLYEIKWDGYRAIAEIGKKETRLYSRNGLSFRDDYPAVFEELKKIKGTVVLDGEITALDKDGKPKFQLLQQYEQTPETPICYYVFDCLELNGKSLKELPLTERKEILKELLPKSDIIRYSDHVMEKGIAFFNLVKKQNLEGMMAKKADSTYHEGTRTANWLKVKTVLTEEAVIAGFTEPRGSRKKFGALILGVYKKNKLVYIGHTGTGFDDKALKEVYAQMQPLITTESPFDTKIPINAPATWVEPKLVCNLKYSEITSDGHRRHPVFIGLRIDKAAKDVHEEVTDKPIKKTKKPTHT